MRLVAASIEINAKPERNITCIPKAGTSWIWWGVERSLIEPKAGGLYTLSLGILAKMA